MNDDQLGELHVPLEPLRTSDRHAFESFPLSTQGTATFGVQWIPEGGAGAKAAGGGRSSMMSKGAGFLGGRASSFLGGRSSNRLSTAISADSVAVEETLFSSRESTRLPPPVTSSSPFGGMSSAAFRAAAGGGGSAGASGSALAGKEADAFSRVSGRGRLTVMLTSAKSLIAADSNGKSDPYCKVSTKANAGGKVEVVTHKSKTIYKTLSPEWNEKLDFEGVLQGFLSYGLAIHVWDADTFSRDDPLGDVWVGLDRLRETDEVDVEEMALEAPNESTPAKGSITFKVVWTPMSAPPVPRPRLSEEQRIGSSGILRVHIERGQKLLARDWNGKSDPYIELRLAGMKRQSKAVKGTWKSRASALNPCWDETIEFHGLLNTFLLDRLELRMKDWDMLKSDDFMGRAYVNLDYLRQHDYEFFDEELTGSKQEDRGSIRFSVHWLIIKSGDGTIPAAGGAAGSAAAGGVADASLNAPFQAVSAVTAPEIKAAIAVKTHRPAAHQLVQGGGRQRALTAALADVGSVPMPTGVDGDGRATDDGESSPVQGRGRSVTLARMVEETTSRSRANSTLSGYTAGAAGGAGSSASVGKRGDLTKSFLEPGERALWVRFVKEGLMPNVSARNPFPQHRDITEVLESDKPLSYIPDEPISARPGGRVSFVEVPVKYVPPTPRQSAAPGDLLASARYEQRNSTHYLPKVGDAARANGMVKSLHNLLENLKERSMQSSYGRVSSTSDSLKRVRGYVEAIWKDTNRLTSRDCQQLLQEMFYQCSTSPDEMYKLGQFWVELLTAAKNDPKQCFLEPSRLTLLDFTEVFVGSQALQLAVCHYIRSAVDETPPAGAAAGEDDAWRCGLSLRVLGQLMEHVMDCDATMINQLKTQVRDMAALVHSIDNASLIVSAAHMDIHSLATIYATFLATFKKQAADPEATEEISSQVERLEKMAIVRQQLGRQTGVILRSYEAPKYERSADGKAAGGGLGVSSVRTSLGGDGTVDSKEAMELKCVHRLLGLMPMEALLLTKYNFAPRQLWQCVTLEDIFRQLNSVKTRLLGKECERIHMPAALRSLPKLEDPKLRESSLGASSSFTRGSSVGAASTMGGKSAGWFSKTRQSTALGAISESAEPDEPDEPMHRLSVEVKSARGLKDGDSKVYARVRVRSSGHKVYKFYTPHVRRQQTAIGVEVASFYQLKPFFFGEQYPHLQVGDDDEIEVYLWEDVLGPDVNLGMAEVPLHSLKGSKEVHSQWYELMKDGKPAGQVFLALRLEQMNERGSVGNLSSASGPTSPGGDGDGREEEGVDFDYFKLSGQWRGLFWQPTKAKGGTGEALQAGEMEIVFSPGGEMPLPHQKLSGTGSDALGSYELRAGRRYTEAHNVEWVKSYTAVNKAYAQLDPTKMDKAEKEKVKAEHDHDATAQEKSSALTAEALTCMPEIFCEGQMDPDTSVIRGYWHMVFRMSARVYKEERYDGDEEPRQVWRGKRAYPAPISAMMLQIRQPEMWEQRATVVNLFKDKKMQRPADHKGGDLTHAEWTSVVQTKGLRGFDETKQGGDVLRSAIRKAKLLVEEAKREEAIARFEPEGCEPDEWQAAELTLPAVHVKGEFVLWQKGLPAHVIYPALANCMPHVHVATLVEAAAKATKEAKKEAGPSSEGAALSRERDLAARSLGQRCLILELSKVERMENFATKPGVAPNLYLVAEVGTQRLICQPLIPTDGKIVAKADFHERFLVFLDGNAQDEARSGKLQLTLKLMNKQAEDAAAGKDQTLGGPPYYCAGLGEQFDELMKKKLLGSVEKRAKADAKKAAEAGMFGFLSEIVSGVGSAIFGDELEEGPMLSGKKPNKPSKDDVLASGVLDVTGDVLLTEAPREQKVELHVPMEDILTARNINLHLKAKMQEKAEEVLQAYGVDAVAEFMKMLGFADLEALMKAFEVPIGELLDSSKLRGSKLHVGRLHVRVACVAWSDTSAPPKPGSSIAAGFAKKVASPGGGGGVGSLAGFDDGTDPYAQATSGQFVQYMWEQAELDTLKKKVQGLTEAYTVESRQEQALKVVKKRVEGRKMELEYATKRQRELLMLDGLSRFVTKQYEHSQVLKDSKGGGGHKEETVFMLAGWTGVNLMHKTLALTISEADVDSLKLIEGIFEEQTQLLALWRGGFERANDAGLPDKAEKDLIKEIKVRDETIGQGGQAHWDFFRNQKRKRANLRAAAYARMDWQHNGMLRRYNSAEAVLTSIDEALRAMIPLEYKAVKTVVLFTVGHLFKKWRFTPPDWAKKSIAAQAIDDAKDWLGVVTTGKSTRPKATLKADVVRLQDYHREKQREIVAEGEKNLAPLAATYLKAKKRSELDTKEEEKRKREEERKKEKDKEDKRQAAAGGTMVDRVKDALIRVPYRVVEDEIEIDDHTRCVAVEALIHKVAQRKQYIAKVVTLDGSIQPRDEARPVHAYYIHVCTHACPRGDNGPGTLGAEVLIRYRGRDGKEKTESVDLDTDNLMRTLRNEVELLDSGIFGWRFEEVDDEKDKERSQRRMYGKGLRTREAKLFESGTTQVFHVEFEEEKGEILGCSIRSKAAYGSGGAGGLAKAKGLMGDLFGVGDGGSGDALAWMVDKLTVFKAPTTGSSNDASGWTYDATGRSWMFQSLRADAASVRGPSRWGPVAVFHHFVELTPQAMVHVIVQTSECASEPEEDDLSVVLHSTSRGLSSNKCTLSKGASLPTEDDSTTRHFMLHYDDHGEPLLKLGEDGGVDGLEIHRRTDSGGGPYMLDSVSMWWRATESLRFFPCYEWLDADEGQQFTTVAHRLKKWLRVASKDFPSPKSDGCLHVGAPPPAADAPTIDVRTVTGKKTQMVTLTIATGDDWKGLPKLATGVSWRVQIVPEALGAGEGGASSGSSAWLPSEADRAARIGFEDTFRGGRFEKSFDDLKLGGQEIQPGATYLFRVAAKHPTFGEGPFSPVAQVVFEREEDYKGDLVWALGSSDVLECRKLVRTSQLMRTEVTQALALGSPRVRHPPDLAPAGDEGMRLVKAALNDGPGDEKRVCVQKELAFEDAEKPPGRPGEIQPLVSLVGDAEIAAGALDLTPLRKGVGLTGACWFHRPLAVLEGFETTFTFKIVPPSDKNDPKGKKGKGGASAAVAAEERQRGSDGFAFVLQLDSEFLVNRGDKQVSAAIGASGLGLGYAGLTSCFAVQFATWPSCARKMVVPKIEKDGEGDGTRYLCSLLYEPVYKKPAALTADEKRDGGKVIDYEKSKRSHFYVETKHEGKECIDPTSERVFVAPELPEERKPKYEPIEKTHTHHCDRVSVQCPGVHPKSRNSSGPEASMANAKVAPLDDGMQHEARIVLERNRFKTAPLPAASEEQKAALEATGALAEGNPSHRLLVYIDDMQTALINLELDADDVFGENLPKGGRMFAGFTAGTGRQHASHIITSWKFFEVAGTKVEVPPDGVENFFSSLFGL